MALILDGVLSIVDALGSMIGSVSNSTTQGFGNQAELFGIPWWLDIVIGGIIAYLGGMLIEPLLPEQPKERLRYWRKKAAKILRSTKMNVELILKTYDVTEKTLDLQGTIDVLEKAYRSQDFEPARKGDDSLQMDIPIGGNAIHVSIVALPTESEEALRLGQVECHLSRECGYSRLHEDVRELREAQLKLRRVMGDHVSDFREEISLVCNLKSAYELTGVLRDANLGALRSVFEGKGLEFELYEKRLSIYGREINDDILSLMKKMITIYY
jgi:hypothetical protein